MNTTEHLLTILAEECAEVAQRATKALRFGLNEVQPGQHLTNAARLLDELEDVQIVLALLREGGELVYTLPERSAEKREKVLRYMEHARKCGTLEPEPTIGLEWRPGEVHQLTRRQFEALAGSGLLWEFYPDAPREWPEHAPKPPEDPRYLSGSGVPPQP